MEETSEQKGLESQLYPFLTVSLYLSEPVSSSVNGANNTN